MQEWAKSAELMHAGLAELKSDSRAALQIHKKYSARCGRRRRRDARRDALPDGDLRLDVAQLPRRSIIKDASRQEALQLPPPHRRATTARATPT
jgi:hypothetical protein